VKVKDPLPIELLAAWRKNHKDSSHTHKGPAAKDVFVCSVLDRVRYEGVVIHTEGKKLLPIVVKAEEWKNSKKYLNYATRHHEQEIFSYCI